MFDCVELECKEFIVKWVVCLHIIGIYKKSLSNGLICLHEIVIQSYIDSNGPT